MRQTSRKSLRETPTINYGETKLCHLKTLSIILRLYL